MTAMLHDIAAGLPGGLLHGAIVVAFCVVLGAGVGLAARVLGRWGR